MRGHHGEAVDQEKETARGRDRARQIVTAPGSGPTLSDHATDGNGRKEGYGHVDEQSPAPRRELGQHAAEHQPDGGATAGDGAVDPESPSPFAGLGKGDGKK